MPTINQLSGISSLSSGDLLPVYATSNGDARKASVSQLTDYVLDQIVSPSFSTHLEVPVTGFNITVATPVSDKQWLILVPAGTLSTGTVTLPLYTLAVEGTEVLVTSTQIITTFTVALNGASHAYGAPTTLAANAFFCMRYYATTTSWHRIA